MLLGLCPFFSSKLFPRSPRDRSLCYGVGILPCRPVVLTLEPVSNSPGGPLSRLLGPPPEFLIHSLRWSPKMHFWQVSRWYWCYWKGESTLRTAAFGQRGPIKQENEPTRWTNHHFRMILLDTGVENGLEGGLIGCREIGSCWNNPRKTFLKGRTTDRSTVIP